MATTEPTTVAIKTAAPAPAAQPVAKAPAKPGLKSEPQKAAAKPSRSVKATGSKASSAAKPTVKSAVKPAAKPASKTAAKPALPAAKKVAPKAASVAKPTAEKPAKEKKLKLVRDSFTMPKLEFMVLDALKLRAAKLAAPIKKTELIRAGIKALAAMNDAAFLAAVGAVPNLKTGRPAKAK